MHKQVPVALNGARVVAIEVYQVGVECECGIAEQEGAGGREGVRKVGFSRRCSLLAHG